LGRGGAAISAKWLTLLLPLALTACVTTDDGNSISFTGDRGVAEQPFPANYRTEIVAFMRTYLNNIAGLRDTGIAQPVQRTVGGRLRYVSCVRYAARNSDGGYQEPGVRAIVFVDGRLDRVTENGTELCAGAAFAPFPELAALSR
jgi:hypothetical protein